MEILGLVDEVFVEEKRQHINSLRNANPLFETSQRLVIESFKYQPGCFYVPGFFINCGKLSSRRMHDDVATEFPRINDDFTGRKTRYMYASRQATYMRPRLLLDGLIKYDLETGSSQVHEFGRGRFGGDSAFAPRPGATASDDGWLLTMVWDAVAKQSELLVIDAKNFTNVPVARVLMPQRVPYGFHATWISSLALTLK